MAGPSWSVQTQAFPSRPARHHAPFGPKTRRRGDRTTTFPCSSHGWPWPVQFPGTPMEPSGAGPFGRGGARERTDFSPSGGNGGEKRGGPKAAIPALGRGGTAERTSVPEGGREGCAACADDATTMAPLLEVPPGALLWQRIMSAPAAYVVTPPAQGAQVRHRRDGDLGPTARHFRQIKPCRLPFRGVTHPRPVWSTNQAAER